MSEPTFVYRNVRNGKFGEMTSEQAAIWPDLLERVEPEDVPNGDEVVDDTTDEVHLALTKGSEGPSDSPAFIPATDYTKD